MMVVRALGSSLALSLMLIAAAPAIANPPIQLVETSFMDLSDKVKLAKGHPNEEHRLRGLKSYQTGNYSHAAAAFERGARYADKFSQHYLSLMHWYGVGMRPDPVQGYIWADLAAERGSRQLLEIREKMWSELTPQQQAEAVTRGDDEYARFGDAATRPRTEAAIRRFAHNMTGSRAGFLHPLDIQMGGPIHGSWGGGGGLAGASAMAQGTVSGEKMYAADRIQVSRYWRSEDRALEGGVVEVGPLAPVREKAPL